MESVLGLLGPAVDRLWWGSELSHIPSPDLSALSWARRVLGQVPSPWGCPEEVRPCGLLHSFCLVSTLSL